MSDEKTEFDTHSGVETTGHSWDGIKELNNPLPRWWLVVWYATIFWAVVYMVLMPAWPALPGLGGTNTPGLLGKSDRAEVAEEVSAMRTERGVASQKLMSASLVEIQNDLKAQRATPCLPTMSGCGTGPLMGSSRPYVMASDTIQMR